MNEKDTNKILAIALCPVYLLIAVCIFFIVAVSRVDAKDNISLSQCWLGSNTGCNKTFDLSNMQGGSIAIDINNVPSGTLSFHTTLTMNLWNWQSGDSVNVGGGYVVDNAFYSCDAGNSNGCFMKCPVSGTWSNCEMWIDTFIAQNDVKVTSVYYLNGNTFNRTFNAIASGSATIDKSTGNLTNGSFNTTINNQTDTIINNQNKNTQDIIDSNKQTQDKLDDTNDYLKDDTPPDVDISGLGNVTGLLPAGPLDSLLNLPFQFLSIIVSSLGDVCVPLSGEFVFGSTLTLPCFSDSFYDQVPDSLMLFINLIPTTFLLINYFKHLYKKVERATSLETNSDDEWGCI